MTDLQRCLLDVLRQFVCFCELHQLRYYLIGGTLIGCIRHRGFIPWDDDIDVGMPRADFDRLFSLRSSLPQGYSLVCHQNTPDWNFNFYQLVLDNSELIIRMNEVPRKTGVWIDVFPIDGLPQNRLKRWIHLKRVLIHRYLIQIANVTKQVRCGHPKRSCIEKFVIKMAHLIPFDKIVNTEKRLKLMSDLLHRYNFDDMPYAGNILGRFRERECVPKFWWGESQKQMFENIIACCPAESEKYLKHIYGDFMTVPSSPQKETHQIEIVKIPR